MMTEEIPIDPQLPEDFDSTPNGQRPQDHQVWWFRPYLVSHPSGGYFLRCLDGGAWDRSTNKGRFGSLPEALQAARELTAAYQVYRSMDLREAHRQLWQKATMVIDTDAEGNIITRPATLDDIRI